MRILKAIIECAAPLAQGSGDSDPIIDQPVSRDAFGFWRVPGSAIAGALRAMASRISPDAELVERLFGARSGETSPSLVWCEDAAFLDYDGRPALAKKLAGEEVAAPVDSFIRDHVRLNADGSAENKFDAELTPAGARFLLEIRLDGWQGEPGAEELALFDALCARVVAGELELGGGRAKGYGKYSTPFYNYFDIDLASPDGQEKWLNYDALEPPRDGVANLPLPEAAPLAGDGLSGSLEVDLEGSGAIIVGGGHEVSDADIIFATTPVFNYDSKRLEKKFILPSTSLKGVFRRAVADILRARKTDPEVADRIMADMFGEISGERGKSGKISVRDCELRGAERSIIPHVAIDRFSGGALPGALFGEEPATASSYGASVRFSLKNLAPHEAALFFHALLDLFEGRLAFGNGVNRGNGRLKLPDWQNRPECLRGDLNWRGEPILPWDTASLEDALLEWELALDERAPAAE